VQELQVEQLVVLEVALQHQVLALHLGVVSLGLPAPVFPRQEWRVA
jgi:hypothetical protein